MPVESRIRFGRLAVLGSGGGHRDEEAYARAARRLGLEARVFDVLHWHQRLKGLAAPMIERSVSRFDPDFILCTRSAWHLGASRLQRLFRGRAAAMWHVDSAPQDGVIELARLCGTLYITYSTQRDRYRSLGIPVVRFLPQAMDPEREIPSTRTRPEFTCDASFVGSGPYPHRWPLLSAVHAAFRLQVRGPGWRGVQAPFPIMGGAVHGEAFAEAVASAAVSLGASAVIEQEVEYASASDRMWKIMGCGGAYLGPYIPGIELMARDGEHCRWFRSVEECVAQIRALLDDPDGRRAMATRGHAHVLAHHTYDHRMLMLLHGEEYPLD